MKDYTPTNPEFSENIPIVEESDLVNADNDNAAAKQLQQNVMVLMSTKVDKEDGKSLVADTERNAWNQTYQQATGYTDQKIAELINGAPSTLDTLGEIADAMKENEDVVEALNTAIGTKANQAEMESMLGTKLDKTGDSKDNTVTFASSDTLTPSAWTDVAVLNSGETHKSIFAKVSSMFKNMRYLRKLLGSTDISAIADGTVAGALNHIASTYLTLSGGTVTGDINFSGEADININSRSIQFGNASNGVKITNNGYTNSINIVMSRTGETVRWSHPTSGDRAFLGSDWTSDGSGTSDIGGSNYRWRNIYASNATIQTSDRRIKKDISEFDDDFVQSFIMGLRPVSYKRVDGDRTHYGLIAQDVEKLMSDLGIQPEGFGGYIKSPMAESPDGEKPDYDYLLGLRYEEFIAPLIKMVQIQQGYIESLKEENQELRSRLERIEAALELQNN